MERRKDSKGKVLQKGESERKDGTYMYRYYGKNNERKCIYAPTLNELREKERGINKDAALGVYSTKHTMNELFYRYLEQNVKLKERTRFHYKTEYDRLIANTWFGKKQIKAITKSDVVMFYKEFKDQGYADGSIRNIHKYISGALNMAFEDDLIRRNYASGCCDPYMETPKRDAMTKEETLKLLSTAETVNFGKNYLLLVKLMLLTGLRVGEATGLTWKDVDMKNRIISVNHQFVQGDEKSRTAYHIDVPKTKDSIRNVPMSNDLYELLKELRETTYFDAYKFGTNVDGYSGFIVHTRTGLPVLKARINDYLKQVINVYNTKNKDDNLRENISCHTCRHTFCTRMIEYGMNIHAVQKLMGHSSFKTTADVYVSIEDKFVNEEFFNTMRGIS